MSDIETAFNKAAEGLASAAAPQGQAPAAPTAAEPSQGQAAPTPVAPETTPKGQVEREWDGKPESLPNELKQDPKAIQRAYTKKAMALADAEKRLKEYEGLNQDEINQYREWKRQQETTKQQQLIQAPPQPTQLTPEQFEYIKNNPEAMQQYVQSLVNNQIQQAGQYVGQELAQIKYQQSLAQWEQTIADFGEIHPDMWEMHEAGLFLPILERIVKAGGTLEDAYSASSKIRDSFRTKAEVEAQRTVAEKRSAASLTGTSTGSDETVFVDSKKDSITAAFELAAKNKEIMPQGQNIIPRGRVKVRKK